MALTRSMLSAMDIPAEKIDEIIKEHQKVVNEVKIERDELKAQIDSAKNVEEELKTAKEDLEKMKSGDWEKKYSDLKSEYDTYKTDVEAKATKVAKESAYRKLLIKAGISEKRIDSIVKVSDINGITLDKDGNIKDADKLEEGVKTEWADFIQTSQVKGADISNPPSSTGGEEKKPSRAAQMVAQYRNEHYGNPTKED